MRDDWTLELNRRLRRVQMQCFRMAWLRLFLLALLPAGFAVGSLLLLLRIFAGGWPWWVAAVIVAAGLAAMLAWSVWRAVRATPDRTRLLAYLDSINPEANAMLVTQAEFDLGGWRAALPLPGLPRFRLADRRALPAALAGAVYAAGCIFIPLGEAAAAPPSQTIELSQELEDLQDMLTMLEELDAMEEVKLDELRAELGELQEEHDGTAAAELFQRIEELKNQLREASLAASAEMLRELEAMETFAATTEALADAAEAGRDGLDAAMNEFADLLSEMSAANPELASTLGDAGLSEFNQSMSAGELREMAENLRAESSAARQRLQELAEQRLNAQQNRDGDGSGQCSQPGVGKEDAAAALQAWLEANGSGADELLEMLDDMPPGSGGVNRGRGDAPMVYEDRRVDFRGDYRDLAVEGEFPPDPRDSMVLATFAVAPEEAEPAEAGSAAGNLSAAGLGGDQRDLRVYPQHRAGVARYFDKQ